MAMHYSGDIVVHVGANNGQEVMIYENSSILGYHIEAIPKIYEELNAKCLVTKSQIAICACLADEPGKEVTFNIASNNALSSSIFPLGRHKVEYPDISYTETHLATTTTLDELIETGAIKQVPDHIVIDTQGAELLVLMGSIRTLKKGTVKSITVECSAVPLYEGGAAFRDVFRLLDELGYYLKTCDFNHHGWCDAIFAHPWWVDKDRELDPKPVGFNIALGADCTQSSVSPWSASDQEAYQVVEGRKDGVFSFHTAEEMNPWIPIDLKSIFKLNEIIVYNRLHGGNAMTERARSLMLLTSEDGHIWSSLYGPSGLFGGIDGHPLRVSCQECHARFVKLQLNSDIPLPLHLDTVEIYSTESRTKDLITP